MRIRNLKRFAICLLVLAVTGAWRMEFEEKIAEDFRQAKLIEPQLDQSSREKLGQRGAFIALGGLRSLVATWRSFIALEHFAEARWIDLEQEYDLITTLTPHNEYHWITGGWHIGTNASGFYERQQSMKPIQRERMVRSCVNKGRNFYLDGIRHNPESWELMTRLASLYDDPQRFPDYDAATLWYRRAVETGEAPGFFARAAAYAMVRSPGREEEALDFLRELWQTPQNRVPSIKVLIFVLQEKLATAENQRLGMRELWQNDPTQAYLDLANYQWKARAYPRDGIRKALIGLEKSLQIPPEESRIQRVR